MTAGLFAPLPPVASGVANHAAELLEVLRQRMHIEVSPAKSDVNIYHLGNNQLHARIYRRAIDEPGIAVVHDAVLQHFALGYFSREEYIEEFVYNYGAWSRDLAIELWQRRALSGADARYFEYPMLRRIAERSRAVIVHNPAAAEMVRRHAPGARVFEIPLLWPPHAPARAADVLAVRARLGVTPHQMLCGVFGHLRETKRLRSCIRATEAAGLPLLIAGACPHDLERSLAGEFRRAHVRRLPRTPDEEFRLVIQAVDIVLNLRDPAAGETSGVALNAMGFRRTAILTDIPENSRYPENGCLRAMRGLAEQAHVEDLLRWMRARPSDAREIGVRGEAHVRAMHSPERVGNLYEEVVRQVA